jgi:hypothetical protein
MTSKKKLKRAIRTRAESEGVSYQEMRRRMGVGAPAASQSELAVARLSEQCLRRATTPPTDMPKVARRIAERVKAICERWAAESPQPPQSRDPVFDRAWALTGAVCDVLRSTPTPEQIRAIRAPSRPDSKVTSTDLSPSPSGISVEWSPEVPDDEICEVAESILVAIGPLVMETPYCGFKALFGGAVYDYVYDPPDPGEYFNEDSDD